MPRRDAVDNRIMEMVRTGTVPPIQISSASAAKAVEVGYAPNFVQELIDSVPKGFITDPSEVGGYPNNANDAILDRNGDGYPNIEELINSTDPSTNP